MGSSVISLGEKLSAEVGCIYSHCRIAAGCRYRVRVNNRGGNRMVMKYPSLVTSFSLLGALTEIFRGNFTT